MSVAKKWLERLEEGSTEAQIARSEKKDLRTVKSAIERARNEQDMALVRREILKEAYRRHIDDMLEILRRLDRLLVPPPDELPLRHPGADQSKIWDVCNCNVVYAD